MKDAESIVNPTKTTSNSEFNRQLNGTAFLSLEHWAYMVLVVLVPLLLLTGFNAALAIWASRTSGVVPLTLIAGYSSMVNVTVATTIAATLLVLAPLLFVLRRRTQAEIAKRPGYETRLAYKLPIYGALAILSVFKTCAFIMLVATFLYSLTLIGVKGAAIGALYTGQFLPALLANIVFALAGWYVFKLAKGINLSSQFAQAILWLSALMVVTLFTTAIMATHNQNNVDSNRRSPFPTKPSPSDYNYWLE